MYIIFQLKYLYAFMVSMEKNILFPQVLECILLLIYGHIFKLFIFHIDTMLKNMYIVDPDN